MSHPRLKTILAVLTLAHAVASFGNLSIPPLTPQLRDELHLTHAQIGMLMSAFYAGVVSSSIPFGWITDLIGERRSLMIGMGIQGAFTVLFAGTSHFVVWCVLLYFAGFGYSSVNPATTKGVMNWFSVQGRATAMGIKQTGLPLGGILASALLPGLALLWGWRGAMVLVGVVGLGSIVVTRLTLPPASTYARTSRHRLPWHDLKKVLLNRNILAISVMGIFQAGAQLSVFTHLVLFLKNQFFFSAVLAGFYLAVCQAGGMAGRIGWGLVSDYLAGGRRKRILLIISVLSVVALIIPGRLAPETPGFILFFVLFFLGFTAVGFHGVTFGLIGELSGKDQVGLTTGFSLTITFLGMILFPPLFGHIVDRVGAYALAWDFLALSWVAALLILVFGIKEKERRSVPASA